MRCCFAPAATATSSTFPPTRWAATSPRRGVRTVKARSLPTLATRRSTRPAFRSAATTRASSRSCPSPCATTAASGCRRMPQTAARHRIRSRKMPATTILSASTPASATSPRVTFPPAQPRKPAMTDAASAPVVAVCISTSRKPSANSEPRPSPSVTATSLTCMSASPVKAPTSARCASTPPFTTPWAASGWTTTS